MSLGLWQDRPAAEVVRTAQAADALGYGEIWIGEMATFDAFALGAVVAERTSRASLTIRALRTGLVPRQGLFTALAGAGVSDARPAARIDARVDDVRGGDDGCRRVRPWFCVFCGKGGTSEQQCSDRGHSSDSHGEHRDLLGGPPLRQRCSQPVTGACNAPFRGTVRA